MNDVQKAARAVWWILDLLMKDKKLSAIGLIEMAYQCDASEAREFVNAVEHAYNLGN